MCFYLCSNVFCLSIKVDKFEIMGLVLGLGKKGSVRNSGEFEIADESKGKSKGIRPHLEVTGTFNAS